MADTNEKNKNQTPASNDKPAVTPDVMEDMEKIISLVKSGAIPREQGMAWIKQFSGFSEPQRAGTPAKTDEPPAQEQAKEPVAEQNGDYSASGNYSEIFDYLKKLVPSLSNENYQALSGMLGNIENKAVEKYNKQADYEKNLKNQNDSDKRRMTSNAQGYGYDGNKNRTFTRAEIGKMSTKEFLKNEAVIFEQLRKGNIQ